MREEMRSFAQINLAAGSRLGEASVNFAVIVNELLAGGSGEPAGADRSEDLMIQVKRVDMSPFDSVMSCGPLGLTLAGGKPSEFLPALSSLLCGLFMAHSAAYTSPEKVDEPIELYIDPGESADVSRVKSVWTPLVFGGGVAFGRTLFCSRAIMSGGRRRFAAETPAGECPAAAAALARYAPPPELAVSEPLWNEIKSEGGELAEFCPPRRYGGGSFLWPAYIMKRDNPDHHEYDKFILNFLRPVLCIWAAERRGPDKDAEFRYERLATLSIRSLLAFSRVFHSEEEGRAHLREFLSAFIAPMLEREGLAGLVERYIAEG